VFAHNLDFPERSRLLRWSSGRLVTLWRGAALQASLRRRVAYLNAGTRGTQLVALDLGTRRTTRIARIPAFTGPLAASPDGTKLAGVAYSSPVDEARPSRLVLVDRGRVRTTALGSSNVSGDLGPVRVVRRLPSPVTHALATVPR
jgi:hypothetical protein